MDLKGADVYFAEIDHSGDLSFRNIHAYGVEMSMNVQELPLASIIVFDYSFCRNFVTASYF